MRLWASAKLCSAHRPFWLHGRCLPVWLGRLSVSWKKLCCGAVSAACCPPHAAHPCAGLRVGTSQTTTDHFSILHHFDHLLLDKASWPALKPDVVLQLGGHMVSKRCMQFLEWAALGGPDRSG